MKTLRTFGLALMTVLLSFGLSACLDDDDEDEETSEIVGTWYLDDETSITFNADRTGYITVPMDDFEDEDYVRVKSTASSSSLTSVSFTYVYNAERGKLVIYISGETITWTDVRIDGNTLTATDEEGDTIMATKQDSDDNTTDNISTSGTLLKSITLNGDAIYALKYDSKQRVTQSNYTDDEDEIITYYTYDEAGNLESIKQWDIDEWLYYTDIKLTSEGYIKSLHWSDGEDSGNASCEYDSDGHLTSLYSDNTDGWSSEQLTWKNGCLTSVIYSQEEDPDDPDGADNPVYWVYGDETNDTEQYTACTAFLSEFTLIGLFGKGSAYLPKSMTTDGYTYSLSYTKNASGAVATETLSAGGYAMTYYYNYVSDASTSAKMRPQLTNNNQGKLKIPSLPRLFGKRK